MLISLTAANQDKWLGFFISSEVTANIDLAVLCIHIAPHRFNYRKLAPNLPFLYHLLFHINFTALGSTPFPNFSVLFVSVSMPLAINVVFSEIVFSHEVTSNGNNAALFDLCKLTHLRFASIEHSGVTKEMPCTAAQSVQGWDFCCCKWSCQAVAVMTRAGWRDNIEVGGCLPYLLGSHGGGGSCPAFPAPSAHWIWCCLRKYLFGIWMGKSKGIKFNRGKTCYYQENLKA